MKRAVISAFLLFHIIAITCWSIPLDSPLRTAFVSFIRPYFVWSGLFQSWDMFAPLPTSANAYIQAFVIYKDGTIRNWKFPRMEQLGLAERYYRERYRKYEENLKQDANAPLWPDAARHIARLNNNRSNPPEIITLVRYWSDIVPPGDSSSHAAEPPHAQIFYRYNVKPEDLQ